MKKIKKTLDRKGNLVCLNAILTVSMFVSIMLIGGCQTRSQTGTLAGTGVGALIGQAVGGDTKATMIGAAIGAGVGHIIGNKQDKEAAKEYDLLQPTALTGTKWKVMSLIMKDKPEFTSMFVEFRPDGKVTTTRYEPGGTMTITEERYRIAGDTLIINKRDYIVNTKYQITGSQMIVDCQRFRAVLQRV